MKNLYLTLLSAVFLFAFTTKASAEDIDLGALELDKAYELATFKNYIGTFTAEKDGVVTVSSTTGDILLPFYEHLSDMFTEDNKVPYNDNSLFAPRSYDFKVEKGKTYYMYVKFVLNANTKVTMTMEDTQTLEVEKYSLEPGGTFYVSNLGSVSFTFNKGVLYDKATITAAGKTIPVNSSLSTNNIEVRMKDQVYELLESGQVKGGDEFEVNLTNVRMASNENVKYGTDGTLSVKYKFGSLPISLVSTQNTDTPFLSYYAPGDENGIITITFNGEVGEADHCELRYGNLDEDASGNYYQEELPVTVNGNSVSVNLQGKRRLPADMVTNPDGYPNMAIGFVGITDKEGNLAYSNSAGNVGSFWFTKTYSIITTNVTCEFSPASGSKLDNFSNIELWITDESSLRYDGVEFAYEKDGKQNSVIVTNYTKTDDSENPGAVILTIPVPDDCKGATNIVVSLHGLTSADGTDYSRMLTAKYNAFIIKTANPVNNSTLETLKAGQTIKVSTNMNSSVGYLPFVLRNMNPAEGETDTMLSGVFTKPEGSSSFTYTFSQDVTLLKGNEYRIEFTAYQSEADFNEGKEPLGTDFISYYGATVPFEYSTVLFSSITPENGSKVNKKELATFVVSFDGLVTMDNSMTYIINDAGGKTDFRSITAEDADAQGYANNWKLTLTVAQMARMGNELNLHISAKDYEAKIVEGNTGIDDESYLHFTYQLDDPTGINEINTSGNRPAQIYRIDGTAVKGTSNLPAGLYIVNGKKVVRK